MHDPPFSPRRRVRSLAMLSISTLLLHAAALAGLQWTWIAADAEPLSKGAMPMQVRILAAEAPEHPEQWQLDTVLDLPAPRDVSAPAPIRSKALKRGREDLPKALREMPSDVHTESATERTAGSAEAIVLALGADVAKTTDAPPAAAEGGASSGDTAVPPPPHYRTQIPPAVTLQYELQRGMLRGNGELAWRPDGDHYELKLTGRVGGISALTQISSGGFDGAGVAPLRFTDQRLARAPMAANFQREAGKVTFSGPSTEYTLLPGTQDRLSWMVQLAAIVSAESGLRQPGATVSMFVVGSRGEGAVYSFRCSGPEAVDTPGGSVAAVKFLREPRDDHDAIIQVWLDPKRHWMPVRARQQSGSSDEVFELRLQSAAAPP